MEMEMGSDSYVTNFNTFKWEGISWEFSSKFNGNENGKKQYRKRGYKFYTGMGGKEKENQKPVAADLYFFTVCKEWNLAVRSQSTTSTAFYGPCTLAVRIFAKCQM